MIPVTKTYFPPLNEYQKQLQRIWKNEWLTNRGELLQELENKIAEVYEWAYDRALNAIQREQQIKRNNNT